jgi:exonuclease SbcD
VKILHTADWHVGKTLRGRSRAGEHEAVLSEIATVARQEAVDLVLVVGDVFDSAAPGAESERIAYAALLELAATGAQVVVLAGNHDNALRLQALTPVLELGNIVIRASFATAEEGGVLEGVASTGERWRLALVPFLSQRFVVRAADLLALDADGHAGRYAARVARIVASLTSDFKPDAVNLVAAHLHVAGGTVGGGERSAHTIFDYAVSAAAFPVGAQYVALGHLHRSQAIAGPCPIRYSGSPLQLDFGEKAEAKSVTVVSVSPGLPAKVREVELSSGRRLRTVTGTLTDLAAQAPTAGEDYLRAVVHERPRIGLADDVRVLFPNAVDVVVLDPRAATSEPSSSRESRQDRSPHDLFADFLAEEGADDGRVLALFDRLIADVDHDIDHDDLDDGGLDDGGLDGGGVNQDQVAGVGA